MTKVSRSYKWHYFKADDDLCFFEFGVFSWEKIITYSAACGMPHGRMKKHTEFESRVTCKNCIRMLAKRDRLIKF